MHSNWLREPPSERGRKPGRRRRRRRGFCDSRSARTALRALDFTALNPYTPCALYTLCKIAARPCESHRMLTVCCIAVENRRRRSCHFRPTRNCLCDHANSELLNSPAVPIFPLTRTDPLRLRGCTSLFMPRRVARSANL